MGIRYREAPESDLHCTLLCEDRFIVVASKLLVGDLIQRGVLVASFNDSLPGANYYLVTLEEAVERAEIVVLLEWVQRMLAR